MTSQPSAAVPNKSFSCLDGSWTLDFSALQITAQQLEALGQLPQRHGLPAAIERLFAGQVVNPSENRAALHTLLRAAGPQPGIDRSICLQAQDQRRRFLQLAGQLYSGQTPLRDLIHVGIGGSLLGPRLVADALDEGDSAIRVHWLSTLDGRRLERLLRQLGPATSGMLAAPRSLATCGTHGLSRVVPGARGMRAASRACAPADTRELAGAVRGWLGAGWAGRSWAATASQARAGSFGFKDEHVLGFPETVGGRFSLWSSTGTSSAALIGPKRFEELLAGAGQADAAFSQGSVHTSMAVVLALLLHHLRRGLNLPTLGVISYAPRLALLADHAQQLIMESLGKRIDLDGRLVDKPTAPLVFGGCGTDLQHSIFQALHQGSDSHPLLLVGSRSDNHGHPDWHRRQLAHLHAQAECLLKGKSSGSSHQRMPGNRPVMTLLTERVNAHALGQLLATLEHAVYALAVLWNINPFDQWGVEEGKRLAAEIRQRPER